jgi:ABC-type glycerol-3-phosphate transport system substrate-binding protein
MNCMPRRARRPRALARAGLGLAMLLGACVATPPPPASPAPNPTAPTATPTSVLANSTPMPATSDVQVRTLRLWLPPQFAPDESTAGGRVLLAQLAAFERAQGWRVEVRVKKLAGQGGLLDALHTSLKAAPSVSPDLIALDAAMLASEAANESPQPLAQIAAGDLADYYKFTLDTARHGGTLRALPFAVDVLGLVYSTNAFPAAPQTWAELKPTNGNAALPLNDPTGLLTLQQYTALGGQLTDANGRISLDRQRLAQALADFQGLQSGGVLPIESIVAVSADATWATYRENRASTAVAFLSAYLADRKRVTATSFGAIPSHDGTRSTFARQWSYALITADPTRQAMALELMRWLTKPENLGAWSLAASIAPARAQALAAWSDPGLAATVDGALNSAQPEPAPASLAILGPVLNAAVQSVLNGQATADQAASTAAAAVAGR